MDNKTQGRLNLVREGLVTAQAVLSTIASEQGDKAANTRNEDLASELEETSEKLQEIAENLTEIIEALEGI